jgi:hypothetical protein
MQLCHISISKASVRTRSLSVELLSKPAGRIASGALSAAGVFENENYDWQEQRSPIGIPFNTSYSDAVVVNDRRILEYAQANNDKMYLYETVHKIIRINNRDAINRFNKVHIPLADANQIITIKARTIHPSGKITEVESQAIRSLENVENTGSYLIFALEGLEQGSEVEYIYQLRRNSQFFGRATFEPTAPVWDLEFEIITPEHLIFEAKSYNNFPDLRMLPLRYPGKNSLYAHVREMAQADEKAANRYTNLMRVDYKLSYNTQEGDAPLYTWADVSRMIRNMVYDFEMLGESQINQVRQQALQIWKNTDSHEAKIDAIIRFVTENIRIEPNEDRLHESPSETIETHIGGRMDIIQLYALLFTIADIPHQLLVTADRNRMGFDSDFVTLYSLEEFVFHFTHSDRYFAPVYTEYGAGIIPAMLQGNQALVVTPPFDEWEEPITEQLIDSLPIGDFSQSIDQNCLHLQADESMENITAYWERSLTGHLAILLRKWHRNASTDEFEALMHKVVQYHVPQATVTGLSWEETDLPNNLPGMAIRVHLNANSLLEYAGENRLLRIGKMVETGIQNNSPEYPFGRHYQMRLQIPEGWQIANVDDLNKSAVLKHENTVYARFHATGQIEGNTLIVNVEEYFPEAAIPSSFNDAYQKVKNCATAFSYVTLVIQKAQ